MSWVKEGQGCARRTEARSSEPTDSVPTHVANLPHDTRQRRIGKRYQASWKRKRGGPRGAMPSEDGQKKNPARAAGIELRIRRRD